MTEKIDKSTVMFGLACLTILELYALYLGYNGTLLKTTMIVVALSIGVVIPTPKILTK